MVTDLVTPLEIRTPEDLLHASGGFLMRLGLQLDDWSKALPNPHDVAGAKLDDFSRSLHEEAVLLFRDWLHVWEPWAKQVRHPASRTFHALAIRLAKGILKAWRIWLLSIRKHPASPVPGDAPRRTSSEEEIPNGITDEARAV